MIELLLSVLADFMSYFNPKRKLGRRHLIVSVIVVTVGIATVSFLSEEEPEPASLDRQLPVVELQSIAALQGNVGAEYLGTVAADSEVEIVSEASGRIETLNVSLGDTVGVGTVIARLENSSQYASLLQAEGAYEAALASAEISNVSVSEAEENLQSVYDSAETSLASMASTFTNILYNNLDSIVADPESAYTTPGFMDGEEAQANRIIDRSFDYLNDNLTSFQQRAQGANTWEEIVSVTAEARELLSNFNTLIDTLRQRIIVVNNNDEVFEPVADQYLATLSQVQGQVAASSGTLSSIENQIDAATETIEKARLGGTTSEVSTANAQIKQALGSLRAAQASYNKTILTSPLQGTVSAVPAKLGQYVGISTPIATVSNTSAFEVTIFLTEAERAQVTVGDTVLLDGQFEGTISAIAPTISPSTGKVEVKIQSTATELLSGNTVRVTFSVDRLSDDIAEGPTLLPLAAIKLQGDDAFVFTLSNDMVLQAEPVTLGRPRGDRVEVTSRLTSGMMIVSDVRGLVAGSQVTLQD